MVPTDASSPSPRFQPSGDVVFRRVGDEAVLVPLRHNVANLDWVHTLSPVAARIWQLMDGTRAIADIVAAVCDEYEVTEEVASADVAELLGSLHEAGLIVETR
jgi:Coenzyme PQQ synthesis protein D (PqqD)